MKLYQVECRAIITVEAPDMQKAALHAAAIIKDNPDLIVVRAVHERSCETVWDRSSNISQIDFIGTTQPFPRAA